MKKSDGLLPFFLNLLFFSIFGAQIYLEIKMGVSISAFCRVLLMLILSVVAAASGVLRKARTTDRENRRKAMRRCVTLLFVLYLYNLVMLLFFDRGFRLSTGPEIRDAARYLKENVNFTPLSTIRRYYNAWKRQSIPVYYVAVNLLGNLFAFAPFGFFLPALSARFRKLRYFVPAVSFLIFSAEAIQLYFRVGSCDIDDFILNFAGAVLTLLFLKIKPVRASLERSDIL